MNVPAVLLAVAASACSGASPGPTPNTTTPPDQRVAATPPPSSDAVARVAAARLRLADPAQAVRDAAASELRTLLATQPELAGGSDATWRQRLASIKPGTPATDIAGLLGVTEEGGMPNGQGPVLRLDDAWTVVAYVTGAGVQRVPVATPSLTAFGPLEARSRSVWVAPPPSYSGRWVTYFANGNVNHDIEYAAGQYTRFTSHFDNGQEAYTQRYVGGAVDGVELGYHPDGSKAYAIEHARGASVGTWTHWYPGGQKQSEQTYVAGKLDGVHTGWRADGSKDYEIHYKAGVETGQAAWDERGTLLYAHGSAKTP